MQQAANDAAKRATERALAASSKDGSSVGIIKAMRIPCLAHVSLDILSHSAALPFLRQRGLVWNHNSCVPHASGGPCSSRCRVTNE